MRIHLAESVVTNATGNLRWKLRLRILFTWVIESGKWSGESSRRKNVSCESKKRPPCKHVNESVNKKDCYQMRVLFTTEKSPECTSLKGCRG